MSVTTGHGAAYAEHRATAAHEEYRAARDLLLRLRGDREAASAAFRWPRAPHFNWALEWFDVVAEGNERTALEILGRPAPDGSVPVADRVTFAELAARSDEVAVSLAEAGVVRGDRVLILLGTRTELWETLLGCIKLGAVVVPGYQDLTRDEAADRIARGGIRHVVCSPELVYLMGELPVPGLRMAPGAAGLHGWTAYPDTRDPDRRRPFLPAGPTRSADPSFCYFTSGTTSLPKLVEHSHAGYGVGHLSSLYWSGLHPGDRHLNLSAPGWAKHSWSSFFVPWTAGATVVAPPDGGLPPSVLPGVLTTQRISSLCAPPSAWRALLPYVTDGRGAPRLREATAAGEPLTAEVTDRIESAWGVRVRDGYGQTEATALIGRAPDTPSPLSPLGHPLPGYRIVLRDPETGLVGDAGEVCVDLTERPPGLMRGYVDRVDREDREDKGAGEDREDKGAGEDREDKGAGEDGGDGAGGADRGPADGAAAVADARTAAVFADGLYRTGDRGERCADGSIRLLGRMDEVFKSYGHRVSPMEIEAVLRTHPAVADAAVIPCRDEFGGLAPYAVVEARNAYPPELLERELIALAAKRLAPVFVPHGVDLVPRLPRTRSGKVRRGALRPGGGVVA